MTDTREWFRKLILTALRWSGSERWVSPRLAGLGAILMLHSVTSRRQRALGINDGLSITPEFLDLSISEMKRMGYVFVSLDEMVECVKTGSHGKMAAITLDDAYLDNLTEALPVFEAHDTPFTIFVAPGLIDGTIQPWWEVVEQIALKEDKVFLPDPLNDETLIAMSPGQKQIAARRLFAALASGIPEASRQPLLEQLGSRSLRTSPFMSWPQLAELSRHRLGSIGAHTVHHYSLARLDKESAFGEMTSSAEILAARLGACPVHFAYPYGHKQAVGAREARLALEAGFLSAVTTRHGTIHPEHRDHLHALPRISLNGRYQQIGHLRTLLSGITTVVNSGRRVVTL